MDAKLSTIEMARLLFMSRNIVNNWEKDENRPSDLKLQQWAEVIARHSDYTVDGLLRFLEIEPEPVTDITDRRRNERRTRRRPTIACIDTAPFVPFAVLDLAAA